MHLLKEKKREGRHQDHFHREKGDTSCCSHQAALPLTTDYKMHKNLWQGVCCKSEDDVVLLLPRSLFHLSVIVSSKLSYQNPLDP